MRIVDRRSSGPVIGEFAALGAQSRCRRATCIELANGAALTSSGLERDELNGRSTASSLEEIHELARRIFQIGLSDELANRLAGIPRFGKSLVDVGQPIRELIAQPDLEDPSREFMNFFEATRGRATLEFIPLQATGP